MPTAKKSFWQLLLSKIRQHWPVLLFCTIGIVSRLWNFQHSLYFIYDQGRDTLVLEKMAHGDFVLVGPTSGLPGFFLGPFWYYVGLPGFILTGGNPFGLSIWYVLISCLSLPLMWWLSHRLFADKRWAVVCALLMAFIPGSIVSSLIIWNPLIAAPLLLLFLCTLQQSLAGGKWRLAWLALAYFLLGLSLQSEFAYTIFLIGPFVLFYPWLRGKLARSELIKELAIICVCLAITFLPQVLFDFRNQHILSRSLLNGLTDESRRISWKKMLDDRPYQLWGKTSDLLIGDGLTRHWMVNWLLWTMVAGTAAVVTKYKKELRAPSEKARLWLMVIGCAVLPYLGYALWRGNYGNFFNYYITPHFLFLLPLFVAGLAAVIQIAKKYQLKWLAVGLVTILLSAYALRSYNFWKDSVGSATNDAGMYNMVAAIDQVYTWRRAADPTSPFVVRVFTANFLTENYDYLLHWRAQELKMPRPNVTRQPNQKEWYVVLESRPAADDRFFQPWYYEATKGGSLRQTAQHGVVTVERWEVASDSGKQLN